ncbi:TetR/AcrR family transcriptional regulator [Caulobacter segnis]|uniref:TetR/AcrR family transcriptional regulator n=1 Tax=Caulobacter segnis TaxID=88688 RepID=UPI001CBC93E9|nr:TetR family transcriptional regulator [Caulobacter segnis]UAL10206.1 TetR family transcriptional regulator [Caulobacter segnis]
MNDKAQATSAKTGIDLTTRGARRREELLEATLRIIVREGPGAVTLRSVIKEAGAAHGSVLYYFGSREEMVHAALRQVADKNIAALAAAWSSFDAAGADPARLAALIARHSMRQMIEDRAMGVTILELHLAAARDASLAPALRDWGRAYALIAQQTFVALGSKAPEMDAAMLTNLINGLVLRELSLPRSDFEAEVLEPSIRRLLWAVAHGG